MARHLPPSPASSRPSPPPRAPAAADWAAAWIIAHLREGRAVRFVAQGQSMWPWLSAGSLLEAAPCGPSELEPGQLVVFEQSGALRVHRALRVDPSTVLCKGDSLRKADPPVPLQAVLGRARVIQRRWPTPRLPKSAEVRRLFRGLVAPALGRLQRYSERAQRKPALAEFETARRK